MAIWKIEEEAPFFEDKLGADQIRTDFKTIKNRLEWLSSRFLFQKVHNIQPSEIHKDQYGKPHHLAPDSPPFLSISHSNGYASVAISPDDIGIDIQTYVEKIYRIQHKYTTKEEMSIIGMPNDEIKCLHVLWTIKEAVFKLYGRKELPFISGIKINKCVVNANEYISQGEIVKEHEHYQFRSWTYLEDEYCYTIARYD